MGGVILAGALLVVYLVVVLAVVLAVNEGCGWSGGLVTPLGISIVGAFLAWSARSRSGNFGLAIRPQIWNS